MKARSALESDSGPCMMDGCCGLGGGKDGRRGEVVKRTLKRPLPSSEPELWATGKRRSRRDSRAESGGKTRGCGLHPGVDRKGEEEGKWTRGSVVG